MPTIHQIDYLAQLKHLLVEPILIVGAREYDFDEYNFLTSLKSWGLSDFTGIGWQPGPGLTFYKPFPACFPK